MRVVIASGVLYLDENDGREVEYNATSFVILRIHFLLEQTDLVLVQPFMLALPLMTMLGKRFSLWLWDSGKHSKFEYNLSRKIRRHGLDGTIMS